MIGTEQRDYLFCENQENISPNFSKYLTKSKNLNMSTAQNSLINSKNSFKSSFQDDKKFNLLINIENTLTKTIYTENIQQSDWQDNLLSMEESPKKMNKIGNQETIEKEDNSLDDSLLLMDICPGCTRYTYQNTNRQTQIIKNKFDKLTSEQIFEYLFNEKIVHSKNQFRDKLRKLMICKQIWFTQTQLNNFIQLFFENIDYICHHRFGGMIDVLSKTNDNRIRKIFNLYRSQIITTIQIQLKVLNKSPKNYSKCKIIIKELLQRLQKWDNNILTYWDLYLIKNTPECQRFLKMTEQIFI